MTPLEVLQIIGGGTRLVLEEGGRLSREQLFTAIAVVADLADAAIRDAHRQAAMDVLDAAGMPQPVQQ